VCAPPGGDIAAGCTPGDLGAFTFGVEPLAITPNSFRDGDTNVAKAGPLVFGLNAPLDTRTLGGIQIDPPPAGTPTITSPMDASIRIEFPVGMGLMPQTLHTVTFPTTITDSYGRPLPEVRMFRFTTGN
jgi:hypothetical protein